jgi:hypothetical protein
MMTRPLLEAGWVTYFLSAEDCWSTTGDALTMLLPPYLDTSILVTSFIERREYKGVLHGEVG